MRAAAARRRRRKGPVAGPASMIRVGRSPHYAGLWPKQSGTRAAFLATRPSAWYDARDLLSTSQTTLPNRVGTGTATLTNGVVANPGGGYVYLPGTANNNLSVTKGAWGGTLHVTATLVDGTTATYTTTADPVLIGNTLLTAGRYKRFDVRENNASGAIHTTVNLQAETLGHASWTCSTGQAVTVNRSTSGITAAVVTRPALGLDGVNDYIQLPAGDTPTITATTGSLTVMLINRVHNLAGAATFSRVYSSESAGSKGIQIYLDTTNARYKVEVGGVTTAITAAPVTFTQTTQLHALAAVLSAGTAYAYSTTTGLTAGSSYTGVGSIVHAAPRVGGPGFVVGSMADLENAAVVTWNRALSASELATAGTYLTGSYT